jgi:hypothetical protein
MLLREKQSYVTLVDLQVDKKITYTEKKILINKQISTIYQKR